MKPVLQAVRSLGGSAAVEEIRDRIIQDMHIPDDLANTPYVTKRGNADGRTQLEYDLAWVRTALKQLGFLSNSTRGVWALTPKSSTEVDANELEVPTSPEAVANISDALDWRSQLNAILSRIEPAAFERLIQRILRETGFIQVEVTGRTGDGGVDGTGVIKINGILSFHVVFQCKRHKNPISAAAIRDFRGAMSGRTDKGLFITTGSFTGEAIKESRREGAMAVDLIDGGILGEKLKALRLGVEIEHVERVNINSTWFDSI